MHVVSYTCAQQEEVIKLELDSGLDCLHYCLINYLTCDKGYWFVCMSVLPGWVSDAWRAVESPWKLSRHGWRLVQLLR